MSYFTGSYICLDCQDNNIVFNEDIKKEDRFLEYFNFGKKLITKEDVRKVWNKYVQVFKIFTTNENFEQYSEDILNKFLEDIDFDKQTCIAYVDDYVIVAKIDCVINPTPTFTFCRDVATELEYSEEQISEHVSWFKCNGYMITVTHDENVITSIMDANDKNMFVSLPSSFQIAELFWTYSKHNLYW